jgi:hypothetical protein
MNVYNAHVYKTAALLIHGITKTVYALPKRCTALDREEFFFSYGELLK